MKRLFAAVVCATLALAAAQAWPQANAGAAAQPLPDVQDSMAQRMQACVVCHGKQGRATNLDYFPRIAGKPQGYLFNQLRNFREGRRHNKVMNRFTQLMSDEYLRDIATYFADLDLPYPPAQPLVLAPAEVRLAETLVHEGAPQRGIPACVACHGTDMAGQLPAMPGLLTLPSDYLLAQFGAWRNGLRQADAPDCMAEIAKRLTPEEIGAVARWLSAQTLPTGIKPQAASSQPLPMHCGSVER